MSNMLCCAGSLTHHGMGSRFLPCIALPFLKDLDSSTNFSESDKQVEKRENIWSTTWEFQSNTWKWYIHYFSNIPLAWDIHMLIIIHQRGRSALFLCAQKEKGLKTKWCSDFTVTFYFCIYFPYKHRNCLRQEWLILGCVPITKHRVGT